MLLYAYTCSNAVLERELRDLGRELKQLDTPPSSISDITDLPPLERQESEFQSHHRRVKDTLELTRSHVDNDKLEYNHTPLNILEDYFTYAMNDDSEELANTIIQFFDTEMLDSVLEVCSHGGCTFSISRGEHHRAAGDPFFVCYECASQFEAGEPNCPHCGAQSFRRAADLEGMPCPQCSIGVVRDSPYRGTL